jgi:hypothetical protein
MPQGVINLSRTPHEKQVFIRAMLDSKIPWRRIQKIGKVSSGVLLEIARRHDYEIEAVEAVRKRLPLKFYNLADEAMNHVSTEKLAACSAPQLMMVAGISVDKARDMEGANRPVFNVVDIAMNITKLVSESKARLDSITTKLSTQGE